MRKNLRICTCFFDGIGAQDAINKMIGKSLWDIRVGMVEAVADGLMQWGRHHSGATARVQDVRDLGGHSGETYGFTLLAQAGREELVIRLAPSEGGARAEADLLRQAPLLAALGRSGAKVAGVRDVSADTEFFGSAFMVVDRLPGKPLTMGPEGGVPWLSSGDRQRAYEAAAAELAQVHRVDVDRQLAGWDKPRTPRDEIALWVRAFERSAEPEWMQAGAELREALLARLPDDWTIGLCHGDFQTNNVLFTEDSTGPAVGGVVDWEIAHVGAIEHDVAWFLMMNDDQAWDPVEQRGGVDLGGVVASYEKATGRGIGDLAWFRALACYRIAAIAGYKIRLHRTGRKLDSAWERASSSMQHFFARAHALLGEL